jgi:hypothetical protein
MQALQRTEIRMRAIEAAANVASPSDDIGNLLVHAEWIASYVVTGQMPEIETEQSVVTRSVVEAA